MTNNNSIRLESTFGNCIWYFNDSDSKSLDKHPEDVRLRYLDIYSQLLNNFLIVLNCMMKLQHDNQITFITALNILINRLADELVKEIKNENKETN